MSRTKRIVKYYRLVKTWYEDKSAANAINKKN